MSEYINDRDETTAGKVMVHEFVPIKTPMTPDIPDHRNPYKPEYLKQVKPVRHHRISCRRES